MTAATERELLSGNRMTALGALDAGCRFFSGYPITPSSEIYQTMMSELPRRGGLALAAPDEISALGYCVGASLAGYPTMTATSGPGWCLMVETIQYAVMTETPVVVALVQRLGPSTGGATQGAQGDVLLAEFCTSGGYTIPVFAPGDARQCYRVTRAAFRWAERLRTPVVVLSDKEVGMTLEAVETGTLEVAEPVPMRPMAEATGLAAYSCECLEEPPNFAPVGGAARVVATGSAHDRRGRLRKNAPEVVELLLHLEAKIAAHADELAMVEEELVPGADTLVVSYGISARAAREACRRLSREDRSRPGVSFLQLLTLFPPPAAAIARAAVGCSRVVVVEENLTGLYARMIEPLLPGKRVVRVNRIGGMIAPAEILAAVEEAR
jgi:2-oxoglutarate/2-oxoacid ferredoxin oxidoreductase subunit alpha